MNENKILRDEIEDKIITLLRLHYDGRVHDNKIDTCDAKVDYESGDIKVSRNKRYNY